MNENKMNENADETNSKELFENEENPEYPQKGEGIVINY